MHTELSTKPADLSERVIFKSKSRPPKNIDSEESNISETTAKGSQQADRKIKTKKSPSAASSSSKLSFAFEDEEVDDDEDD